MNIEHQRVRFINTTMDMVHDLCDDLYEALFDEDFDAVEEILQDLTETFKNEI
jgi:predicted phosphoribosyltransferase